MLSVLAQPRLDRPPAGGAGESGTRRAARLGAVGLAVLCLASAAVIVVLGTRLDFFNDDWWFLLQRPGLESHGGLDALLAPHNSQLVFLLALAYKVLVAIFGLGSQAPFRVVLALAVVALGCFVYLLVSARLGVVLGLVAAALVLFLGTAWEDLLFFASLGTISSLASGLAAIWALRVDTPRRNALACLLLVVSVGFFNLGVPFAIAAVAAVWLRRRPSQLWIPAVPLLLFAAWWLGYGSSQPSHLSAANIEHLPRYLVQSAASGLASVAGVNRGVPSVALDRGYVLLGLAVVVLVVAAIRGWRPRREALIPAAALLSYWLLTGASYFVGRAPTSSRYQLVDVALLLVLAAELYRPQRAPRWVTPVLVLLAAFAVWSNLDSGMRYGYHFLRAQSGFVKADLAALELGRRTASPGLWLTQPVAHTPYLSGVTADRFFAQTAAHGNVRTYSVAELSTAPADQRAAADSVLAQAERLQGVRTTFAPAGGCVRLLPGTELPLRPGPWLLRDVGASAVAIGARRFADPGTVTYFALAKPGWTERLTIPVDSVVRPWRLSVKGPGVPRLEVCRG